MFEHTNIFFKSDDACLKFCLLCNISNLDYKHIDNTCIEFYYNSLGKTHIYDFLYLIKSMLKPHSFKKLTAILLKE